MDPVRDPEGIEVEYLNKTGAINGRSLLEIGCGNGRLTWRYANLAAATVGTPECALISAAVARLAKKYLLPCYAAGG